MSARLPGAPPAVPKPGSARRRRLRWTVVMLLLVGSVLAGWIVRRQTQRPAAYRPDESSEDITRDLARALPPGAPVPRWREVTSGAGLGAFRSFEGTRTSQLPEDMGPGLAWGDYDNDGDDDLFVVGAGGGLDLPDERLMPSVLFENRGGGTFRPAAGFPELRIRGNGAAWADYDGDGFLDLAVAGYNALRLYRNEGGTGRFVRETKLPEPPGFWSGVAWGDFDRDRRLDLYACNYVEYAVKPGDRERISDQVGTAVPFTLNPASFPGGRNALFQQRPDGSFTNVAAALGVENPAGRSLGAVWHDFDQDGWLDLYVANDVSDNVYYRNVGGRFEDRSHAAWVADYRSAMGLAVGDFDRDGDDDLHVTHWVAQENALYENLWADLNGRSARAIDSGRTLPGAATNRAPGEVPVRFMDIADQKGLGQIALPRVGWGTEFADLDQDGWLDLLVVNGSTLEAEGPAPRRLVPQSAFLFWSDQGRHFHDLAPLVPSFARERVGRGLGTADYDGDGDLDVAMTDLAGGVDLYANDMAAGGWLKVRLRSRNAAGQPNGFGDGAVATAWVGGVPLRRAVSSGSYLSQSSHVLHWGLGTNARIDRLEIRWLGGGTNVFPQVEGSAFYEAVEDGAVTRLGSIPSSARGSPPAAPVEARRRQIEFWERQRAAMNAMKVEQDNAKAVRLFREAIALDPRHEDSRYYLGLCLAGMGDDTGALAELEALQRINPQSHRAWQQWGVVRAVLARSAADYADAERALDRAHALNPEETGVLLLLGELALLQGREDLAASRLESATRTNPRATGGFFLRGYLAWKRGDAVAARELLGQARATLGAEWQPKGSTSEGDVQRKQHVERTPLARFWEAWNGGNDPGSAYEALEAWRRSHPAQPDSRPPAVGDSPQKGGRD